MITAELVLVGALVVLVLGVVVYIVHVVRPVDVKLKTVLLKWITFSLELHGCSPDGERLGEASPTEIASKSLDEPR